MIGEREKGCTEKNKKYGVEGREKNWRERIREQIKKVGEKEGCEKKR